MILIVSKEEKELIQRLRELQPVSEAAALTEQVLALKRQIADLEITKAKKEEQHASQERELRHMIGLEQKRQSVEMEQAKREAMLAVREENLKAERTRFEEQLKFNTARFESMEKYLKDMMADILQRLPNVNMELTRTTTAKR